MKNPLFAFLKDHGTKFLTDNRLAGLRPLAIVEQHKLGFGRCIIPIDSQGMIALSTALQKFSKSLSLVDGKCSIVVNEDLVSTSSNLAVCQLSFGFRDLASGDSSYSFVYVLYNAQGDVISSRNKIAQHRAIYKAITSSDAFTTLSQSLKQILAGFNANLKKDLSLQDSACTTVTQHLSKNMNPSAAVFAPAMQHQSELLRSKRLAGFILAAPNVNPLELYQRFFPGSDFKAVYMSHLDAEVAQKMYTTMIAEKDNFIQARGLVYLRLRTLKCDPETLVFVWDRFWALRQSANNIQAASVLRPA